MNIVSLRYLSTTAANLQRMKIKPKIVNKVLNFEIKKKRKKSHTADVVNSSDWFHEEKKILAPNRRVEVLNKIFMRTITDLMATGEVAPKLLGKGLEITRIKITPDFKFMNVYYYTYKDTENDVQEILNASAGHLKHELSQLQIITNAPSINFVKDKKVFVQNKVEDFLANMHMQEKYGQIDDTEVPIDYLSDEDECKIELPEMKHNVMGFEHDIVMNKIKTALKKVQNPVTQKEQDIPQPSLENIRADLEKYNFITSKERRIMFDDFLKQRKINSRRRSSWRNKNETIDIDEDFVEDTDDEVPYDFGDDIECDDIEDYESMEEEKKFEKVD